MTLLPGCRFIVAPHFHLPADWPRRLLLGPGVEERNGHFFPLHSWRVPTSDELSRLVWTSDGPTPEEELDGCVCLYQLPGHLHSEWWKLLAQSAGGAEHGRLPGFESFASRMAEFLAFKSIPVPEGARCDVVVTGSGQRLVDGGSETTGPAGLKCNLAPWVSWPWSEEQNLPRLWGGVNLGDEETSVVLVNLSCQQLAAVLHSRFPDQPAPATVGELVGQFLHFCADYPLVRLILGPGEGYRLPRGGLIVGSYLEGKQEPDVLLLITHEPPHSS
jgi:hypothetical protein